MARPDLPVAPRIGEPDLPRDCTEVDALSPYDDLLRCRITGLSDTTDASHAALTECIIAAASVDRLDLLGATLVDVEIDALKATSISAREARLRRVRFTGGRIGTLDLAGAGIDEVELRGIRIDYLSLAAAKVEDLLIADCTIVTLDLPQATLSRVRFESTRADEVDTRGMRADSLDLRGLEAASYLDVSSLRGATLTPWQVEQLAPTFASSLGIDVQA
ncbi:UNVERIFIED_CONTAM: pentapeptide repeat-containing protein [Microbacterium sp. SLM126]